MAAILDRPAPAITHADLMLATPGKLFSAPGWLYELKYDGFRCPKRGKTVRLDSRTGRDMAAFFPELVDELQPIPHDFVADGELCDARRAGATAVGSCEGRSVDLHRGAHDAVAKVQD